MTDQNKPEVPETVGELLGDEDGPAFDPRELPGAEVIYDGTDEDGDGLAVVAVPLSAFDGGNLPSEVLDLLSEAGSTGLDAPDELDAVLTNFQQMSWALDEIDEAAKRHGESDEDGPVHSAFPLLACVDQPYMAPEEIFRAHCAEMLDRVAAGADTQPPTEAEMFGLLVDAARLQPFCGGLTSLYITLAEKITPEAMKEFMSLDLDNAPADVTAYKAEHAEDAQYHREQLVEMLTRPRERAGRGPLD
jgi:hypothetical protein